MSYWKTISTDNATGDAFGRLRVSTPATLFDSKQVFDNQPLLWDDSEESGSGTTAPHSALTASTTITVSATTAGKRTRQTFQRFNYQPGKSQLIFMTGVLDKSGGDTGITRGFGLGDDDNGIFLYDNEGVVSVLRRTNVSGTPDDTDLVAQANWNIDPMDGTGPSGVTIDFTKALIFVIDLEWLGVGRVRVGFNIDGKTCYAHQFLHANVLSTVYMSTPNLPLRYWIENDGTGAASTLEHICASVQSEGGEQDTGVLRYASTNGTEVTCASENVTYAIIGMRLKSANVGAVIKLLRTDLTIQSTSKNIEWTLRINPTVASTFTYSDQTNSSVQIATGASANTVTGGTVVAGGFSASGSSGTGAASTGYGVIGAEIDNAIKIGADIAGNLDTLVFCVTPRGGSSGVDVEAGFNWRELS